jgi:DNA-binding beta-propeller fold protein YncE
VESPNTGNVYVGNEGSNTVSVISNTITPIQAIQNLINTIDSFHLPKGVTTSLEASLNAALAQLNHNIDTPACNQMPF